MLLLLFIHTLLLCHILLFGRWIFSIPPGRVSNSLDPDQARHFVRPDLGQNCLQRLSAGKESILMEMNNVQPIPLMWYIFILLFFRILALENIAQILTTGPRLVYWSCKGR